MKYVALLFIAILSGCAGNYPAVSQPRALGIGGLQPYCAFFCFQTVSFVDSEGSGNATGGTSSQSGSLSVGVPKAPLPAGAQ